MEVCRQVAEVDGNCKARKGFGSTFPIELGRYRCKTIQDTLALKHELSSMNLEAYTFCLDFDDKDFAHPLFELRLEFSHVPQLEDFWANCDADYEVRKRWWSRLTLKQIKEFKLQMNVKGVQEDKGEEVVDPFYIT